MSAFDEGKTTWPNCGWHGCTKPSNHGGPCSTRDDVVAPPKPYRCPEVFCTSPTTPHPLSDHQPTPDGAAAAEKARAAAAELHEELFGAADRLVLPDAVEEQILEVHSEECGPCGGYGPPNPDCITVRDELRTAIRRAIHFATEKAAAAARAEGKK